jgi:hypothetical protein
MPTVFFNGSELILPGAILVVAAWFLRRRARRKTICPRDPLREVQAEFRRKESSPAGQLNQLEVRLYDFAREVEGRIQTRISLLNQLVLDADREIDRLQQLIARAENGSSSSIDQTVRRAPDVVVAAPDSLQSLRPHSATSPAAEPMISPSLPAISDADLQTVYALTDAGFRPEETAAVTGLPVGRVTLLLHQLRTSPRSRAA